MKTLLKSSILFIALIVQGCGDDATNDGAYEYGALKSDPPMPPLTYEWSHPDCPFTASFPGEPEVEEFIDENGDKEIIVQYLGDNYAYQTSCDLDRLEAGTVLNTEILDYYVEQTWTSNDIINIQIIDFEKSIFSNLPHAVFHYTDSVKAERSVSGNSLIFYHTTTLFTSSVSYLSEQNKGSNGAEFFETVKLK